MVYTTFAVQFRFIKDSFIERDIRNVNVLQTLRESNCSIRAASSDLGDNAHYFIHNNAM